jgi:hypothetical protein
MNAFMTIRWIRHTSRFGLTIPPSLLQRADQVIE